MRKLLKIPYQFFTASIRRQLILGIAVVHAVLMAIFVFDLVDRQREFLHTQAIAQAGSLARTLSTNSTSWILANDIIGMEEVIASQSMYPGLKYSMLLSPAGQVLSHTDRKLTGRFVNDPVSMQLLNAEIQNHTLINNSELIDIATPVIVNDTLIGWARVGLSQHENIAGLRVITRDGLLYMLLAIMAGIMFAYFMARGLTTGLQHLVRTSEGIKRGDTSLRANLIRGDELGQLSNHFNQMLDALANARKDLALSQQRLELALRGADDGIFDWDLISNEVYYSPRWKSMLGYEDHELGSGYSVWKERVHPDDIGPAEADVNAYIEGQISEFKIEFRMRHKDGHWVYILGRGHIEKDEQGNPVRFTGTHTDITARKQAELELKETNTRFTQLANNINEVFWLTDHPRQNLVYVSPAYETTWGRSCDSLYADPMSFMDAIHPDDRDRIQAALKKQVTGEYDEEFRVVHHDGTIRWVNDRAFPISDNLGKVVRIAGIAEDITRRKEAEFVISRSHKELESRVESRTRALKTAKEEAEKANQAKSEFLSSMSHELRTPLNAIIGFGQLLSINSQLQDDQKEQVNEVIKAGQHLLDLINEILDLSKIEAGHLELSLESVDLPQVIEESINLVGKLAEKRHVSLHYNATDHLTVYADRTRLKQALVNLLSNAIKYNVNNGQVNLNTESLDHNQAVRITVNDTGKGIAPELLDHIFEPFNRLGAENSDIEGTGIGLALTRRLVEAMNGQIDVQSTLGTGSSFCMKLPAGLRLSSDSQQTPAILSPTGNDQEARTYEVLYIEDNPSNLKLVSHILGQHPHIHLIPAHTPELGIELAEAHLPDLILLDINMPNMNGFEVLNHFKANPIFTDTPVIAISANAMPAQIARGKAAGFNEYITKPIKVTSFFKTVQSYLQIPESDEVDS